jgi:hypothetical protein
MQIDIPAHIEKLLFLNDHLTIPGFGGFSSTRTGATADYIGGKVTPPSKTLVFMDNMTTDDGILTNDIASTHNIPVEDAKKAVNEFVEKMQELLAQREIVTLPGVGRLYKNYVQKIQFLPDATNFNTESFGLPPLQFSPIARSREVEEKTSEPVPAPVAEAPVSTPPPAPVPPPVADLPPFPNYTPLARSRTPALVWVAFVVIALGAGTWWWRHKHKHPTTTGPDKTTQMVEEDITVRDAPKDAAPPAAEVPATGTASVPEEKPVATAPVKSEKPKKEASVKEPKKSVQGGKSCILIVATLQEKNNADRLSRTLKSNGYDVYFLQKNGYQVGIEFNYRDLTEVQQKILALQKLTGENQIWIKKK